MSLSRLRKAISGGTGPAAKPERLYDCPTLEIGNSFCHLHGFSEEILSKVKDALTYKNPNIFFEIQTTQRLLARARRIRNAKMEWVMEKKLNELIAAQVVCFLKGNMFPTGHLPMVREILGDCEVENARIEPQEFHIFRWNNRPPEMRYYQKEIVALAQEYTRGVFECAVGSGKTLILANIIKELGVTSLVILPSSALLEQTRRVLEDCFGAKFVSMVTTKKVEKGGKIPPIRLTTVQTLSSLRKKNMLGPVLDGVGMVYVDEVHHAGSQSYVDLLPHFDKVYYRFGGSGTFLRNDYKTMDMWGFLSNRLYLYTPQEAIKDGFLTPVNAQVFSIPGRKRFNYQNEYTDNFCGNPALLDKILDIVTGISKTEQILILVDRKEKAGEIIHKFLNQKGFKNSYISGDNKKEEIINAIEDFNDKKTRILVGSTVIGEGVDVHSTQHLILAQGGKSVIKLVQAIGRCVRLHPGKQQSFLYDFLFEDTTFLKKHSMQRIEVFKEYFAGEVRIIGGDDAENPQAND